MQQFSVFGFHGWARTLARRPWLVTIASVIVCAGFAAHAATSLIDARYFPEVPGRAGPSLPRPAPGPRGRAVPDGSRLVERNMFCSSCRGGAPGAPVAPGAGVALTQAQLIATSLGREPYATLVVTPTAVQGSWGLGDAIPGLGRLDRIAPTWIEIIDDAGHRGRLSLLDAAADRGADTAMSRPAAAAWSERLQKLDDQTYEVDRSLVREVVTGQTRMAGVRPVPLFDHGAITGVRLLGVSETSIPAALGLRSGDLLTAVNGAPIQSLQQLFDLYAGIDQLTSVEVSGTRAGKPLVRTLRLR